MRKKALSKITSFRIDEVNLNKLKAHAEMQQINLNALVNNIFADYLDWYSGAAKAGFISIRKVLMTKLLEKYSESDMDSIAEHVAKTTTKDITLFLRQGYDMSSALDVIENWIKISGYSYDHVINNGTNNYIIHHELGRKWSVYLAGLYRFIFREFRLKNVRYEITPNTLAVSIDIKTLHFQNKPLIQT